MLKKVVLINASFFLGSLSDIALASDKEIFDYFISEHHQVTHNYNIEKFKDDVQTHIKTHNIQQLSQELDIFSTELEEKKLI